MTNKLPTLPSNFQVIRELGRGGMGIVYLAIDENSNRKVAIKTLPMQSLGNDTLEKRFAQEIQLLKSINHPSVVKIFESGTTIEGVPYIVMEYVEGVTLEEICANSYYEDWRQVLKWGRQICDALGNAHRVGIIHRDIKPQNIMITPDSAIKLMDFGIAKSQGAANLTQDRIIGTPAFMSPEQGRGAKIDHRSDIYSLGCVFYTLLAGRSLFGDKDSNALEIIQDQINSTPVHLTQFASHVPLVVAKLVHEMLEKDPDSRPSNVQDVVKEIDLILSNRRITLGEKLKKSILIPKRFLEGKISRADHIFLEFIFPGLGHFHASRYLHSAIGLLLSITTALSSEPIIYSLTIRIIAGAVMAWYVYLGASFRLLWIYLRSLNFNRLVRVGTLGSIFIIAILAAKSLNLVGTNMERDIVDIIMVSEQDKYQSDSESGMNHIPDDPNLIDRDDVHAKILEKNVPEATTPVILPVEGLTRETTPSIQLVENFPKQLQDDVHSHTLAPVLLQIPPPPSLPPQDDRLKRTQSLDLDEGDNQIYWDHDSELVNIVLQSIEHNENQSLVEIMHSLFSKNNLTQVELAARGFIGYHLNMFNRNEYNAGRRQGWSSWEEDSRKLSSIINEGFVNKPDASEIFNLALGQRIIVTMNFTRVIPIHKLFESSEFNYKFSEHPSSTSDEVKIARLVLARSHPDSNLSSFIAEMVAFTSANSSLQKDVREMALRWFESHGNSTSIEKLENILTRNIVLLPHERSQVDSLLSHNSPQRRR